MLERVRNLHVRGLRYGALNMTREGVTPVLKLNGPIRVRRWMNVLDRFDATEDYGVFAPLLIEDGARETVLQKWQRGDRNRRKLQLSEGERLDAPGVMKRLAGDSEQFTAWPQTRGYGNFRPNSSSACAPLTSLWSNRTRDANPRQWGVYDALPFDASLLYRFRLDKELSRARIEQDELAERRLSDLRCCIDRLSEERTDARAPVPYAAILKADGDRMGELLSKAGSANGARDVSSALGRLASNARAIVREGRGHAVYAGGDDALAFLPLAQARKCSRALADAFAESLEGVVRALELSEDERPTLSVGIGIGPRHGTHDRAPRTGGEGGARGEGIRYGTPSDALAVMLGVRSGAELLWRARWSDTAAFDALDRMADAFRRGLLPTRVAYDLRGVDRRLAWLRDDDGGPARSMTSAEVGRLLERARLQGGREEGADDLQELIAERARVQPLRDLADMLIVARWLSARTAGDPGERA